MHRKIESFEDLEVFKRSYAVSLEIHKASLMFPKEEQFGMASQIRRASKSICANLAEGYGKRESSVAEFKRFVTMAIGSADEMRVWLRYCLDLGYIDEDKWEEWRRAYKEIVKMLQGLNETGIKQFPDSCILSPVS